MNTKQSPETLTVLYDGGCPLCRREIAHAKGLADQSSTSALCFVDISQGADGGNNYAAERTSLLARFHIQHPDGSRLDGAAAFVAMWDRLPGWRWIARFSRLPGMLSMLELAYRVFLHVRPGLQWIARRWEAIGVKRLGSGLDMTVFSLKALCQDLTPGFSLRSL